MKKVLGILLAVALTVVLAVPVIAVTTGVTVETGGGNIPVVKCKWESPDQDTTTAGIQIIPPGVFDGTVQVKYFVVVTDEEDGGDVGQVWVDVSHPDDWLDPQTGKCGSFKYEVPLTRWVKSTEAIKQTILTQFTKADDLGLVTYGINATSGSLYTYSDVWNELDKCTADVWRGNADLTYHQPAGDYKVEAFVIDQSGNQAGPLENCFEYVALSSIEIDFTGVEYGSTSICKEKWISGDTEFGTGGATVRNIGNTDVKLKILQNDMGFGHTIGDPTSYSGSKPPTKVQSNWNVVFDARLGSNVDMGMYYDPDTTVTLPNKLKLCNTEELDFSIHIKKATAGETHTGTMTITWEKADWDTCPS